jgi:hypothetical protein
VHRLALTACQRSKQRILAVLQTVGILLDSKLLKGSILPFYKERRYLI